MTDTFATALNCMDGRVQLPVNAYLRRRFDAAHIDMITAPGIVAELAGPADTPLPGHLIQSVRISVQKHGSRRIAVVAHYDCGGNAADDDLQRRQAALAAKRLADAFPDCEVIALWLDKRWEAHEVPPAPAE